MAQTVKNLPAIRRPGFDPWVRNFPWRREWPSTAIFLPRESHGQRILGYRPWGHRDTTEWLSMHTAAAAAKSLQSCLTLCDPHRRKPTRLSRPWDSLRKNTGVGRHFLLQCVKGKSESEVTQSCPTLSDPMDCSLPGSSIHGIFQARVLEWGAIAFSKVCTQRAINIFPQNMTIQQKSCPN